MFVLEKQKSFGPWYAATIFWNARLSFKAVFSALWRFLSAAPNVLFFIPKACVQQLSFQAFINQKLLILKKNASTYFFWYAAEWQAIGCQFNLSGQIFPSKEDKGLQKGQD